MTQNKRKAESQGVILGRMRYGSDVGFAEYVFDLNKKYAEEIERADKPRTKSAEVRKAKKEAREKQIQEHYLSFGARGEPPPSQKIIAMDLGVRASEVSRALKLIGRGKYGKKA